MSIFDKAHDAHLQKIAGEEQATAAAKKQFAESERAFTQVFIKGVAEVVRPLFEDAARGAISRGFAAKVVDESTANRDEPFVDFQFVPSPGSNAITVGLGDWAVFRIKADRRMLRMSQQSYPDERGGRSVPGSGSPLSDLAKGRVEELLQAFIQEALNTRKVGR